MTATGLFVLSRVCGLQYTPTLFLRVCVWTDTVKEELTVCHFSDIPLSLSIDRSSTRYKPYSWVCFPYLNTRIRTQDPNLPGDGL